MNKKEEWMKEEYQDMIEAIESHSHIQKKTISSKEMDECSGNGRTVRT